MEMFELRYFQAVAEVENIQKASEKMAVSSSSLSKAISRLEEEFEVELFEKTGRGIKLTLKGQDLLTQCKKIFDLETETRAILSGDRADLHLKIAGPEVYLSHFGVQVSSWIHEEYPSASFQFMEMPENLVAEAISNQTADIGFSSNLKANSDDLNSSHSFKINFSTYVGKSHPLSNKKNIDVQKLLVHDFLTPSGDLLGLQIHDHYASDGWREDKFPRKIKYAGVGLKTLETLVASGKAIAYLPEYLVEGKGFQKIEVIGCPFKCQQKISIITKKTKARDWIRKSLKHF